MRINHNITALNTYRQLSMNNTNSAKSIEKLSSGLRINRAGDDAAGLAISEKMRAQIRGLDMAAKNAQDGISLIQIAEGALNETHAILQKMRELAVQAANGTNTDDDRRALQNEIDQLNAEIDRIADTTEFNTMKLLNGEQTLKATLTAGTTNIQGAEIVNAMPEGDYTLTVADVKEVVADFNGTTTGVEADDITLDGEQKFAMGTTITFTITEGSETGKKNISVAVNGTIISDASINNTAVADDLTFDVGGSTGELTLTIAGGSIEDNGTITFTIGKSADYTLNVSTETTPVATLSDVVTTDGTVDIGTELRITVDDTLAEGTADLTLDAAPLKFQIGANSGQSTSLSIGDMRAVKLGTNTIDISTLDGAQTAIDQLDEAIKTVSMERSKLGAYQNRLEHTINNLGTSSENLSAAESRIRDVDMAKEMMEFTKNSILTQAAQAMLAQATQTPQGVLQLLR